MNLILCVITFNELSDIRLYRAKCHKYTRDSLYKISLRTHKSAVITTASWSRTLELINEFYHDNKSRINKMMHLYRSVLHTDNFNNISRDIIITLSYIIVARK